jgi:transcription initiation factor IIE alpha subunit
MAMKKRKQVSFDAMVKFFMQYYNIPTKKDIEKLMNKMDRLEKMIKASTATGKSRHVAGGRSARGKASSRSSAKTASDKALEVIKRFKKGAGFAEIQARTGFEDKKLRNVIFRLHKDGIIIRKSRGIYIAS